MTSVSIASPLGGASLIFFVKLTEFETKVTCNTVFHSRKGNHHSSYHSKGSRFDMSTNPDYMLKHKQYRRHNQRYIAAGCFGNYCSTTRQLNLFQSNMSKT